MAVSATLFRRFAKSFLDIDLRIDHRVAWSGTNEVGGIGWGVPGSGVREQKRSKSLPQWYVAAPLALQVAE
ncbi:MAG: hypothetical protein U9Q79_07510 [Candidatus Hydrogenedentes bacterium]|nr:hypothetical protein [Candidatus Hydrogenedentota bacterium]